MQDDILNEESSNAKQRTNNLAYDQEFGEWIPFSSPADALVAALHLRDGIPPRHVNSFLSVLRDPALDVSKLSFSHITDIDKFVGEYRQERSLDRARQFDFASRKLPLDAFGNIISIIAAERLPLSTDDQSMPAGAMLKHILHQETDVSEQLKTLALVHPTLTPLAQCALGERILALEWPQSEALQRSPLIGPWTYDLALGMQGRTEFEFSPSDMADVCRNIIARTPNLRFLRLDTSRELGSEALAKLLDSITRLKSLNTLYLLMGDTRRSMKLNMDDVCRSIACMPKLRTLVLKNAQYQWRSPDAEKDGLSQDLQLATHNLETLSLTGTTHPVSFFSHKLSWLLCPPQTQLTSLSLELTHPNALTATLSKLSFPKLRVLRIRVILDRMQDDEGILRLFPSLPALHLFQISFPPPVISSRRVVNAGELQHYVPPSVTVLYLCFGDLGLFRPWSNQEAHIVHFLQNMYERREMMEEVHIDVPSRWLENWGFETLHELCNTMDWSLELTSKTFENGFS